MNSNIYKPDWGKDLKKNPSINHFLCFETSYLFTIDSINLCRFNLFHFIIYFYLLPWMLCLYGNVSKKFILSSVKHCGGCIIVLFMTAGKLNQTQSNVCVSLTPERPCVLPHTKFYRNYRLMLFCVFYFSDSVLYEFFFVMTFLLRGKNVRRTTKLFHLI